jgi:hypothetical protein
MKSKIFLCLLGMALILTACPTPRALDANNATTMREFAPNAVGSATQFLRGAPVDVSDAALYVQQSAQANPRLKAMFAKTPTNLATAFSRPQLQSLKNPKVQSQLNSLAAQVGVKPQGNACGGGNTTDADGDGIPALFNYTFDCSNVFYDNFGVLLTGSVSIKDLNDNDPASGYDSKVSDLTFIYFDAANNYGFGIKMNYDAKVRVSTAGKYTVSQNFNFVAAETNNGVISRYEYYFNGTLEYTPNANALANTRFAKGTLKFVTKFGMKIKTQQEDYFSELEFKSTGLQVDFGACGRDKMVNSGNVQFTDGKNTLTWTVTGCGDGTWNYNNQQNSGG